MQNIVNENVRETNRNSNYNTPYMYIKSYMSMNQ